MVLNNQKKYLWISQLAFPNFCSTGEIDKEQLNTPPGCNTDWQEQEVKFDGVPLTAGDNELTLTVSAGDLQSGVVWDYLRLEMQ